MRKIVFIINTEFVLLISYLYYKLNCETNNLYPIFIFNIASTERFSNIEIHKLPGIQYKYFNNILGKTIFPKIKLEDIKNIEGVENIVWQNPGDTFNHLIFNLIKKESPSSRSTVITDSIAVDSRIDKSVIRKTLLKRLYRKTLNPWLPIPLKVSTYHTLDKKEHTLIAHNNIGYNNFIHTDILLNKILQYRNELNDLFNYKTADDTPIIFFTQPITVNNGLTEKNENDYNTFIKTLIDICIKNKLKIYFKVHPGESIERYLKYENDYVKIYKNKNIPAELILNSLSGATILSMWSSISVFDIKANNKHYWLYPLINYKISSIVKYNNINIINTLEQLETLLKVVKLYSNIN